MKRKKSGAPQIDRIVSGVGRITVRTGKMTRGARNDLDRAIVRAAEDGLLEQLRLLKNRTISPLEFLDASRRGRLAALRPPSQPEVSPALRPLVERWLTVRDLRGSSEIRYRQSWHFLFEHLSAQPTVGDLTPDWWLDFVEHRQEEVGNATLNRDRAAYLAFRSWLKAQGKPVIEFACQRFKEEPEQSRILTPKEVQLVRERCRVDRWPLLWALLGTGARQGEILNLRRDDVTRRPGSVTIISQPGSKSRGRTRIVPIPDDLADCLDLLASVAGDAKIFPYSRYAIDDWWRDLASEIGIRGVTLHGIRATYITQALDNGVPATEVQKLVGHRHLSTTMKYYRNNEVSRKSALAINTALGLLSDSRPTMPEPQRLSQRPEKTLVAVKA